MNRTICWFQNGVLHWHSLRWVRFQFLKRRHQLREGSISRSKRTIYQYSFVKLLNMKKSLMLIQFACLRTSFQSPNVADINTGNENQWSNQLPLRNSNGTFDFVLEKLILVSRTRSQPTWNLGWSVCKRQVLHVYRSPSYGLGSASDWDIIDPGGFICSSGGTMLLFWYNILRKCLAKQVTHTCVCASIVNLYLLEDK